MLGFVCVCACVRACVCVSVSVCLCAVLVYLDDIFCYLDNCKTNLKTLM